MLPQASKRVRRKTQGAVVSQTHLSPGKVMEHLILETITAHMDDKMGIRSRQHGVTEGKSCLTSLIAFCDETAARMDERRARNIVYLEFSKAFKAVSHNILTGKLSKCGLCEWTERWFENWLKSSSQRVVISGTGSGWRLSLVVSLRAQYWAQYCLTFHQ